MSDQDTCGEVTDRGAATKDVLSRRHFLWGMGGLAASAMLPLSGFPSITGKVRPRLRVLGTHVTLQEAIRKKAESELGIQIQFEPGGSAEVLHKAATNPEGFDTYEQWSNSLKVLWEADAIQGIEVDRIRYWPEINNLTKKGRIVPDAPVGAGDAPSRLLYAQTDGTLSSNPTGKISFLPYVHNVDSFGYDTRSVPKGIPYETESWSWLLDPRWHGKVAIVNAPTIGLFDLVLALVSRGQLKVQDLGNLTRSEIDALFEIIVDYRKRGHFRGTWHSVPHSVHLMANREVVIESMFSPAVSTLRGMGVPCVYAAPREGYRAWHGVMCLSRAASDEAKEAAYAYMNWWLSGWAGAFIARQGYYISNPERSRPYLSKAEWDYWYEGKPAREPLQGTDGKTVSLPGEVRTGGSYVKRFSNVAVWNSVMEQYEYTLLKWNEFLLA